MISYIFAPQVKSVDQVPSLRMLCFDPWSPSCSSEHLRFKTLIAHTITSIFLLEKLMMQAEKMLAEDTMWKP